MESSTVQLVVFWILGGAGFAAMLNQVLSAWQKLTGGMKETPPPASTYRTREDCNGIHSKDRDWIRAVERKVNGAATRDELRQESDGLHARIERTQETFNQAERRISAAVGELKGVTSTIRKGNQ